MAKLAPLSVPSSSQPSSKLIILRNAVITLVSLALAAVWIALGPHGDFLNGRAFTISTLDQVSYVYYNWSFTLPLDPSAHYRFQAQNSRLIGKTSFVPSDRGPGLIDPNKNKITVSIETTARPNRQLFIDPWTGQGRIGFSIFVSGEPSLTSSQTPLAILSFSRHNYRIFGLFLNAYRDLGSRRSTRICPTPSVSTTRTLSSTSLPNSATRLSHG